MIIFLSGRVNLNMTLVVATTGALCRSESVFFLLFSFTFSHSNFKILQYLIFCDVVNHHFE